MNRHLPGILSFLVGLCACMVAGMVRAEALSETVILVASSLLDGSPLQQTVVVATPLPDGSHVGFILNRPTTTHLEALFPDDSAVRNVVEPVYLGGPGMLPGVFAVTRESPDSGKVLQLLPGVVAVMDAVGVDQLIAATPNEARYFVGLMAWDAGDLERQVQGGLWEIQSADPELVLRRQTRGLWNALRGQWVRLEATGQRNG